MNQWDGKDLPGRLLPRQEHIERSLARDLYLLAHKPLRKLIAICSRRYDAYVTHSTYHLRSYASTLCVIASPILYYEDIWSHYRHMEQVSEVGGRYLKCLNCLFMPELLRTKQIWADLGVFEKLGLVDGGNLPVQVAYSREAFDIPEWVGESLSVTAVSSSDQVVNPAVGAYPRETIPSIVSPEIVQILTARIERSLATKPYLIIAYFYITSRLLFDYGEAIRRCLLSVLLENHIELPSKEATRCSEEAFSFWSFNSQGNGPPEFDIEEKFERNLIVIDQSLSSHERLEIFNELICVVDQLLLAAGSIYMDTFACHAGKSVWILRNETQDSFSAWWHSRLSKTRREKERESHTQRLMDHVMMKFRERRTKGRTGMSESTRSNIRAWQEGSQSALGFPSEVSVSSSQDRCGKKRRRATTEAQLVQRQEPSVNCVTLATLGSVTGLAEAGNSPSDEDSEGSSCRFRSVHWKQPSKALQKITPWKKIIGWTSLVLALIYGYHNGDVLSRATKRLFYSILAWQTWIMLFKKTSLAKNREPC
ncbi:hypothetical protein KEM54_005093 [Ascosphaera aggregata]|nr:hypothetical protein KEM54_005093 [Ascosphaera aggregata]